MQSKKELYKIALDTPLNRYENMGKLSANKRQLPYYGKLRHLYPKHFLAFKNLISKHKCAFESNLDGLIEFIIEIGDIPLTNSKNPLRISKICTNKGYVKGNIMWDTCRKSYRPHYNKDKIATQNQQKKLIEFLIGNSFENPVYLTNELIEELGYSSFYTLERSLKKLNYNIIKNAYGYYIENQPTQAWQTLIIMLL